MYALGLSGADERGRTVDLLITNQYASCTSQVASERNPLRCMSLRVSSILDLLKSNFQCAAPKPAMPHKACHKTHPNQKKCYACNVCYTTYSLAPAGPVLFPKQINPSFVRCEPQRSALIMREQKSKYLMKLLAANFDFDRAVDLRSLAEEVSSEPVRLAGELDRRLWDAIGGLPGIFRLRTQSRLLMRLTCMGEFPEQSEKMKAAFRALRGSAPLCAIEALLKFFFPTLPRANARVSVALFADLFLQSEAIIEHIDSQGGNDVS